jgi:hypothetical protein
MDDVDDSEIMELEEKEDCISEEEGDEQVPPEDIIAYNELRSCADLFRMYKGDQLTIQPDFQREIVWSNSEQTRFIDSLSKQLPIPSMCISLDYKTNTRLVVDGLQRISTIIKFLNNPKWKLSTLKDVDSRISGRYVSYIKERHGSIYSMIENVMIPITLLRCDYTKKPHMRYLFTIFKRLNTGGIRLNNQEIRNCIYQGGFNDLLKGLVNNERSIELLGYDENRHYRFKYEELFLRVFAFSEKLDEYKGRLAVFLNNYMGQVRDMPEDKLFSLRMRMVNVLSLVYNKITEGKSLEKTSKTVVEALLVGVYRNYDGLITKDASVLKQCYAMLRSDHLFSFDELKEGLSGKEKVISRIRRSIEIFSV